MHLEVLNTAISSSGFSLCNGSLTLTAQSGFSSYYWNGASTSQTFTVNSAGNYFVLCTTSNGQTCQSPPITIYQDTIPISLSTPDSVFVCQGDTVIIDGPLGFSQYNWNTGATTPSITTTSTLPELSQHPIPIESTLSKINVCSSNVYVHSLKGV